MPDPERRAPDDLDPIDAVAQLSFAVHEALGEVAAAHDMSLTQMRLLGVLRDRAPAMLDLARHLGLGKSSVTGLIDRAERRGLVERAPAPRDGRGVRVRLTAAGRRLTETVEAGADERLEGLLAALPARDRARLATLAGTVVRAHAERRGVDLRTLAPDD